ncbi:MAG: hypothetical protein J6L65_05115 [Lachnospiraceae bacterium]|nr:hypothetical protein [Lachnospiraceae bacterium]
MHEGKVATQAEARKLHGIMHDKCGRWLERRKRVVPREVCAVCSERSNHSCKDMLNAQKSAEVIVIAR